MRPQAERFLGPQSGFVHILKSWKSYGKLANQIPGLEKLWKNVILVRCPGNVLEFILELRKISRSSTFTPDFIYWGERTGQKNATFF